jgi:hypothetical protein
MGRCSSSAALLGSLALVLAGCESGDSDSGATTRVVNAGTAHVEVLVRSGTLRYRLAGRLDTTAGYRLCARISRASNRYLPGRVLWLEGRNASYGTLTGRDRRCRRDGAWFDDHPPTLDPIGAEDHLHAALLALRSLAAREVAGSSVVVDFARLDREPPRRDEDGWTLRPLLRGLGHRRVQVRINPAGFVDRLRLVVPARSGRRPATVALRLSRFGRVARVRHVVAYSIE